MKDKIVVIDDAISPKFQDMIENITFNRIQWQFVQDVTYANNDLKDKSIDKRPAFVHLMCSDGNVMSEYMMLYETLIYEACNKAGIQFDGIMKGRSFLQLPLNTNHSVVDPLHIDLGTPHLSFIYYVKDSDGDTLFVNKKFGPNVDDSLVYKIEDYDIIKRVTPKKGRVAIFDGWQYHTAEQPKNNVRCIANFNLYSQQLIDEYGLKINARMR